MLTLYLVSAVAGCWAALYFNTFRSTPNVSPAQIAADGGKNIDLPDGRIVEYFVYGCTASNSTDVMVFFHGYTLSGSVASSWHASALQRGIRIISVSMAGWGGSSPQRGRSYFDAGLDAMAVLHAEGVIHSDELLSADSGWLHSDMESIPTSSQIHRKHDIHIVGTSFGAGNAAALASLIPHRVQSLSLIIPAMPSGRFVDVQSDGPAMVNAEDDEKTETRSLKHKSSKIYRHDMWSNNTNFVHWLVGQPFFDRIWQYYVAPKLDIPSLLKSLAPADWAEFIAKQGDDAVAGMTHELQRSTKYHHEGACDGMRLLRGDDDDAEFEHADQQTGSLLNAPMKWLSPLLRHFSSSSAPAPRSSSSSSRPSYYSRVIPALRWLRGRVSVWYALHDQLAPAHHGEFLSAILPEAHIYPQNSGHLGMFASLTPFIDEMLSNQKGTVS